MCVWGVCVRVCKRAHESSSLLGCYDGAGNGPSLSLLTSGCVSSHLLATLTLLSLTGISKLKPSHLVLVLTSSW